MEVGFIVCELFSEFIYTLCFEYYFLFQVTILNIIMY